MRMTVMDAFDEAMLSFALRELNPRIRFVSGVGTFLSAEMIEGRSIPESDASVAWVYFPPPNWIPRFEAMDADATIHQLANPPIPGLHVIRSKWSWGEKRAPHAKWAFSLPTLLSGRITCYFNPDSADDRAFQRRIWRLLDRLLTSRLRAEHVRSGTVYYDGLKGGATWAGHHALEWCSQAPDRMLDGCRRPADDWCFPDDPWLLDLRRRVIECFGLDYGAPPQ